MKNERARTRQRLKRQDKRKSKATLALSAGSRHTKIKYSLLLLQCFFETLNERRNIGFDDELQQEAYEGLLYCLIYSDEHRTLAIERFIKGDSSVNIVTINQTPSSYTCG